MSSGKPARRRAAAERASYTGEGNPLAARGIGRGPAFGLDTCSDDQRRLRALLALYLINQGRIAEGPGSASAVLSYNLVVSPQFHELRLVTDCPRNVMGRLVGDGSCGIPGMRLAAITAAESPLLADTFELVHLPTRARVAVTQQTRRADAAAVDACSVDQTTRYFDKWIHDVAVTDAEAHQLSSWPSMSVDAERLFAGLVSRLNLNHPAKKWGVALWYWDPCRDVLGREELTERGADGRRFWGIGDHWQLTWDGYPFIDDLVHAVSDRAFGIPGVVVTWQIPHACAELGLGDARLLLTHHPRYADVRTRLSRRGRGPGA